ncbi:hypothetical protein BC834DRAFT_921638 [Gloeopeniophorella convolvens]|nr:hypothetical protein BC834DRAFT_921638 [Gloeopeniophorella convolvens]
MCHNIIDGRYHTLCGHFMPLSTRRQDCMRPNCLFSTRHPSGPAGCESSACQRLMGLPIRNPIRLSPTHCPDCVRKERERLRP